MQLTIYGAAQEVTGSMHLLEVNGSRVLMECGLYQGHRADTYKRNQNFPFDPATIDAVILSHAHIDHSGNIPNLVKQGFTGNIWCTAATRNLCTYMLMDSGHIQEQDVAYLNKKRRKRGEPPVDPIYTRQDAQESLSQFVGIGLHRKIIVADGVELTFYDAGHILGAAHVCLDVHNRDENRTVRLVFSGDIGRDETAILKAPESIREADVLLMESTYGDRLHGTYEGARRKLRNVVNRAARRQGKVIIPSFAVGRTQEIVYSLNQLDAGGDIPELPIFVDSPLAVNATDVFRMHPEAWNQEVQTFLTEDRRKSPFDFDNIEYVRDVRRSKQLNAMPGPAVVISASGMAENGRILHHLKHAIEYPQNTILLVSFMAQHTLGRRLKDGEKTVKIFGDEYDVRASVESIDGYSAHADQQGLLRWAGAFDRKRPNHIILVHGESTPMETLAELLRNQGDSEVSTPVRGQRFELA